MGGQHTARRPDSAQNQKSRDVYFRLKTTCAKQVKLSFFQLDFEMCSSQFDFQFMVMGITLQLFILRVFLYFL